MRPRTALSASPKSAEPEGTRGIGILVGDDETVARQRLARWLKGHGFSVRVAANGRQAVRAAGAPDIQIVLLDSMMPGPYDGLHSARLIRTRYPEKGIVFISALWDEAARQQARQLGLEDAKWVGKPVTEEALTALVETIEGTARDLKKRRLRQLWSSKEAEGMEPARVLRLVQRWDPELPDDVVEELLSEASSGARETFLEDLSRSLAKLRASFAQDSADIQGRQLAFGPLKEAVVDRLWGLYEKADPNRRRIALQIRIAVRKLTSLDLQEKHLAAMGFVLSRLAQARVTREDVKDCERSLRYEGIETLMDLGGFQEPLLTIYREDD